MRKLIFTLILILIVVFALALSVGATNYLFENGDTGSYVHLDSDEVREINTALENAYNQYGAKIYIGMGYDTYYDSYSGFLSKNYLYNEDNMIILFIEYAKNDDGYFEYFYKMHLLDDAVDKISIFEEGRVLDHHSVYDNIKDGNLKEGICNFIPRIAKAYTSTDYTPLFIGLGVGVVLGVVIFLIVVITRYRKKQRGDTYPFDEFTQFELTHHSDVLMNKTVTRVRINRSRGGGGGGGGGSRSSGRR